MLWYTHKMWVGIFLSIVHMLHANDIPKEIHLAGEELTTISSSTTTANATCGASNAGEWFYNPLTDTCFFISTNQMFWDDAELACNNRASQLASVTVDDNAFLLDIIKQQTVRDTSYWIGLRLTNPSLLTHHWIDGNLENVFRNWNRDEPDPKGVQACTLISNIEGFWLDDYCHGVRPYRYICKKSKAPLIPATTVAPEVVETWGCPSTCVNCVRFGDSCYYISPRGVQVTWDEARNACRAINPNPTDQGGHSDLVSIHDQLENDFLFAQMGLHDRQNRWIGLHEDWQKSVFYWSDQTPFNFNFWEQHEPLTTFEPECILIVSGIWLGAGEGRWNDISCQAKQGYICKMKKDRSVTVPVVEVDRRCDPNFEYIDGACFGVFPANSCEFIQPGSRLATVTNIHENVFIRLLLAKLQRTSNILDADVRALLGGVRSDSGRLSWQSGCYPSYNNIRSFYSDPAKRDTCVYMNYTGEWSTKSCADTGPDTRHQYVVCEKRQVECSKLISTNNGTCPDGFDDPCHDYCYKISHSSSGSPGGSPVNLTTARTTCSNLGGSLVAIRNEDDQKCIGKYIESATVNLWLGLYEKTGNVNGNLLWAWPDGTIANYDHWNAGEPSDMHVTGPDREECAEIMSNGFWNNVPCYGDRGYICEKLKIDETTAIPLSCPNGWTTPNENSQNCYKVFYAPGASSGLPSPSIPKLTWQEAENSCSDFKGHLASITSQEEQNHLRSILGWRPQHYSYWIGLYEDGTSWKWSDDTPFLGVQFFDSSSNSSSEHAHDCVGINYNGNWLAQNCLLTWGWICEVPKGVYLDGQDIPTLPTITTTANETCGVSVIGEWFYNPLTDSCFLVSQEAMSWSESEISCLFQDSQLATVFKDDNSFLTNIISRKAMPDTLFWIGLRLTNPSLLTHHWIDGTFDNVFRHWAPGEPNPKGVQACVLLSNLHGFWLDDYCAGPREYRFICKKNKAPVVPATTVAPELVETWGCPSTCLNCVRFRDSCYYISPRGVQVTWDEARNACLAINPNPTDRGGHSDLVSIHDQFAQMGLHDRQNRWIGLHEDWQKWVHYWSDQTPFDFDLWEQQEPQITSEEECVMIVAGVWLGVGEGRWNDISCRAKQGYICKMKKDRSVTAPVVEADRRCDPNFEYINGACFGVFPTPSNTDPVFSPCQSIQPGSRLATVTNIHENVFIRLLLARLQHNISTPDIKALLGGTTSENGRLTWSSGCYPSYNNIRGFYSDPEKKDSCLFMQYSGEWSTKPCLDRSHQFVVCEKRQVECSKVVETNNLRCPIGFDDPCNEYCYRISHSSSGSPGGPPVSLEAAKTTCSNLGGSIVAIRNEDDQNCIAKYIESANSNLWLGLYEATGNTNGNLRWQWLDGSIATYYHWNEGEPNDMHIPGPAREECTEIMSNGFWNNVPCTGNRGYICEKLKIPAGNDTCGLSDSGTWVYHNETDSCYFHFQQRG
ncbi:Macrophage mannose receptor 1 [Hypsibius exemplaris]|uniref:Macrophage mannose receptor 1 n=1 Tax=Hypsibius exemplaris TaxID=2072580 RepID=A0A1W0W9W1_HYPEX|nr:Macrophage mannose receptor 1 [Hypsibius exemplaris]